MRSLLILALSLVTAESIAKIDVSCEITDVGRSFNRTEVEVIMTTDAKRRTRYNGEVVIFVEGDESTRTKLIPVSGSLRHNRERDFDVTLTLVRGHTCTAYFSGEQEDR